MDLYFIITFFVLSSDYIFCDDYKTSNAERVNTFYNTIFSSDRPTCFSKDSLCVNEENKYDSVESSKNVGWIAKPLMEALWAFSPDPSSNKTSALCSKHVRLYKDHLNKNYLWATQMLDSSTLTPGGILYGNNYQLGHFDQCLDIAVDIGKNKNNIIRGQYCLAKIIVNPSYELFPEYYSDEFIRHPYDLYYDPFLSSWTKMKISVDPSRKQRNRLYWSICVPSSCSPEEIELSLKEKIIPALSTKGIQASVTLDENFCHVKSPTTFTTGSLIFLLFCLSSLFLVVIFSLIDIAFFRKTECCDSKNNKKGKLKQVMLSFSIYQNLLNLNKPDGDENLNVMHGMRTYTTALVMLGHRCMFSYGGPFHNPEFLEKRYRSFSEIFILNGFLIVDTFFVLSGFLTCYMIIVSLRNGNSFNLKLIYLHRLLRILPLYGIVLAAYVNIFPLLGDGPLWSSKVGTEVGRCINHWWANVLFVNNYVDADICMFQSWFLTCDMHFFIFGPILAYILNKRPHFGIILTTLLLIVSIIIPYLVIYSDNLDGVLKVYMSVVEDPMTNSYVKNVYIKSHNRAGPYIIGILAAYLYYELSKRNHKFSPFQVFFGSVLCAIFALGSLLLAWIFYMPGRRYNVIENALYSSLHRIIWACAMSWIIIAGATTGFGTVNPVLCMKPFLPLSRLTYGVFLIHGMIQLYTAATIRVPEYIRFPKLLWMWSADVILSFALALIVHLLFEAPVNGMSRLLLSTFFHSGKPNVAIKEEKREMKTKSNSNNNFLTQTQKNGNKSNKKKFKSKSSMVALTEKFSPKLENKYL